MQDPHRLLVQSFLSKKFMTEDQLKEKVELLNRTYVWESDVEKTVRVINKHLELLSLKIRKGRSEDSGRIYYGLVNLREDEAAKIGAEYAPEEMQFFKDCLEAILECEEGEASSLVLLGMSSSSQGAGRKKVTEKDSLLERFTRDGWLSSSLGKYYPGPRTVLELYPHLSEMQGGEVVKCTLCREMVVRRERCESCDTYFHLYCMERLKSTSNTCPKCKVQW